MEDLDTMNWYSPSLLRWEMSWWVSANSWEQRKRIEYVVFKVENCGRFVRSIIFYTVLGGLFKKRFCCTYVHSSKQYSFHQLQCGSVRLLLARILAEIEQFLSIFLLICGWFYEVSVNLPWFWLHEWDIYNNDKKFRCGSLDCAINTFEERGSFTIEIKGSKCDFVKMFDTVVRVLSIVLIISENASFVIIMIAGKSNMWLTYRMVQREWRRVEITSG